MVLTQMPVILFKMSTLVNRTLIKACKEKTPDTMRISVQYTPGGCSFWNYEKVSLGDAIIFFKPHPLIKKDPSPGSPCESQPKDPFGADGCEKFFLEEKMAIWQMAIIKKKKNHC